jgi:hypothetical protein
MIVEFFQIAVENCSSGTIAGIVEYDGGARCLRFLGGFIKAIVGYEM